MEHTSYRSRTVLFVAVVATALLAAMWFATGSAFAAPGSPDGPTAYANPTEPPSPDPQPSHPWLPDDPQVCAPGEDCAPHDDPDICSPDQDCTPDEPGEETPDTGDEPGGSDIPTPTRIDTGAGGAAGYGMGVLLAALAAALSLLTVLAWRHARPRGQR